MLTQILLIANLVVSLLLVAAVGYIWNLLDALSSISVYISLYLNDKYEDFGDKQFEPTEYDE